MYLCVYISCIFFSNRKEILKIYLYIYYIYLIQKYHILSDPGEDIFRGSLLIYYLTIDCICFWEKYNKILEGDLFEFYLFFRCVGFGLQTSRLQKPLICGVFPKYTAKGHEIVKGLKWICLWRPMDINLFDLSRYKDKTCLSHHVCSSEIPM